MQDLDANGNPVGESSHDNRPDTALEKAKKHWRAFWDRFLRSGSYFVLEDVDEEQDMVHGLDGGTFFRDITGQVSTPAINESTTLVAKSRPMPSKRVLKAVAISDRDPLPVVLYSVSNILTLTATSNTVPGLPTPATVVQILTKTAVLKADQGNANPIWFTANGVAPNATTGVGYPMYPGDVQVYPVKDLATILTASLGASQRYTIMYIPDPDIATKV